MCISWSLNSLVPPPSPVLGYKMSKLSGNPFVSHGRTQDTMTMTMTMTMTYDILAIIGVNKVGGSVSLPHHSILV